MVTPATARASRSPMSVTTRPGATMLVRMPCGCSSTASVRPSASSATLPIMYGAPPGMTLAALTLEISTTSPRSSRRICGSNAWHSQNGPYASVRITRSSSSGSVSTTMLPRLAMPALHTSTSTRP